MMEANLKYTQQAYWDERFSSEAEYEWLASWTDLRPLILPFLPRDAAVLIVGNGNSALPADLAHDAPSATILSTDYSSVAVSRAQAAGGPANVSHAVADMLDLEAALGSSRFDVVIDKGALDALVAVGGDSWTPSTATCLTARRVCDGVSRVLKSGGVYLGISFSQPHFRLPLLLQKVATASGEGAATGPAEASSDDDMWEPDLTPGIVTSAVVSASQAQYIDGTVWTSCDVIPVNTGLGYFMYALRSR